MLKMIEMSLSSLKIYKGLSLTIRFVDGNLALFVELTKTIDDTTNGNL